MASKPGCWWSKDTIAVVTGANTGIGFESVRALAEEGVTVVLTARDPSKGQAALDALKEEGLESVVFHPLEITNSESVKKLATWLKKEYGGIDILINNAAIEVLGPSIDYDLVEKAINTNYYGTKSVTEALLPLLRSSPAGARIVNVSSGAGLPRRLGGESLRQKFNNESNFTLDFVDSLAAKYLEDVKAGRQYTEGWIPEDQMPAYGESKIFLHTYTIALAKALFRSQPEDHQIFVTSFNPGATQTAMFDRAVVAGVFKEGFKTKTARQAADTGVWLALLPKAELVGKNAKFFQTDKTEIAFITTASN